MMKAFLSAAGAVLGVSVIAGQSSNYVFRFNTGVSRTFLDQMTFQREQPLDLGECTVTQKVNGPLSCALNCQNEAVCLLELSGPPGSGVGDVMEKVSETPVTAASPVPSASPASP